LAEKHIASQFKQSLNVDVIENWILEGYCLPGLCEADSGDYVLDIGAFNGNSTLYFAKKVGAAGRVFALEPDPSTVEVLQDNINNFKELVAPIEILNFAAADRESELRFSKSGAGSRVDPKGETIVKARTIDDIVHDLNIDHLDVIKFDVEGYEKQALAGAENTIKRFRPKLMVCLYHLAMDIVEIPTLIHDISPWYKMYVRHHAEHDGELVMYCVPISHHAKTLMID
jgi:FkbM family methyltransferase